MNSGETLGPYHVLEKLGAGGMGEVYRARDTRLNREVAIKILPASFAADPDRVARFTREAQTLAALNHPHIAQIHGVEDSGGTRALVMELVDGEDLAQRLASLRASGASAKQAGIPPDEALPIARQIAEALEAAHEAGVVHRDLKPANIKVRPDGTVKILDFGLAKSGALGAGAAASGATVTSPAVTLQGVILGTAAYMSPEQARGTLVDARADLWAFGCVLFEMLTGTQPFAGDTVTDVLASVVKDEPRWDALPAETPAAIRTLLRRCLQKERRKRLASAADARIEIEDVLSGGSAPAMRASPAVAARRSPLRSIATAAALLVALAGGYLLGSRWGANPGGPAPVTRFVIGPPAGTQIVTGHRELAISKDGHQIAFIARGASDQHIYVRRIDELTPRQVTGTDGARDLAFSPDGRSLVFHSGNRIRIVSLAGGAPTAIAEAVHSHGLAWHPSEPVIYFSPHQSSAIWKVAIDGGSAATQVTTLDSARGEISHEWPILTDDGRRLVFTSNANGGGFDRQTVSILTLATNDRQTVRTGGNAFALTGQGDLLYVRMGALMRGRYAGGRLDSPVLIEAPSANEHVAMSPTGALAFVPEPDYKRRSLIWIAPDGRTTDAGFGRRAFASIALSPDGRRAAFTISDDREDTLYLGDLSGGLLTPLATPGPWTPVWSPDGRWIAGTVRQPGRDTLTFSRVATEVGRTWEILTEEIIDDTVTQWTRDGRGLLVSKRDLTSGQRYVVELALGSQPPSLTPVADSGRDRIAQSASLSPDGRWLAYESNESGRLEVYVQAYPTATSRVQVSREGGQWPLWSKGGDVLYFRAGSALLSSAVTTSPALRSDPPRVILRDPLLAELIVSAKPFDVAPDGRVLAIREDDSIRSDHIVVVQNWLSGVQAPNR